MKNGQVALALTGGYFLGRYHKIRWAMALASAVAGKRLRSQAGEMGSGLLQSSPELNRLAADIREDVLSAGKTVAVAAAGNRINALSDKMQDRADALRAGIKEPSAEEEEEEEKKGENRKESGEERRGSSSRGGRSSRTAEITRGPSSKASATRQSPKKARDSGARRGDSGSPGISGRPSKSTARAGTSMRRQG
ncbi:MAG: hypothetical protein JO362_17945 [Streptomycetaceae bacterium]|nr:hypothetical protein [Streptomycetaceae bacterium]